MADPGSGYSSGAFSGMGGGGLSETEIDRDIGRQMALGPTREFDASAWYGEDETYGTQGDWLTGEGLTTRWGEPTSAYPSYANPFIEGIATNPAMNMLVNAEGMLKRGGGPGPWDYAALGLSAIPGGSWALRTARPYVKNAMNAYRRRNPLGSDYSSAQLNRPLTEGSYLYEKYLGTIPHSQKLDQYLRTKDVLRMPADEFYAMHTKMQDRILQTNGLSRNEIELVHWAKEGRQINEAIASLADELGNAEFAAQVRATIVARNEAVERLASETARRLGIYDEVLELRRIEVQKHLSGYLDKRHLKPDNIDMSFEKWDDLIQGKTLSEVKDIARKLTLRVVD